MFYLDFHKFHFIFTAREIYDSAQMEPFLISFSRHPSILKFMTELVHLQSRCAQERCFYVLFISDFLFNLGVNLKKSSTNPYHP